MDVENMGCGIRISPFMGGIELDIFDGRRPCDTFVISRFVGFEMSLSVDGGEPFDIQRVPMRQSLSKPVVPKLVVSATEIRTATQVFEIPDELRSKISAAFRGESTFSTMPGRAGDA